MKLFGKLFGKSAREDSASSTARHRAPRHAEGEEQGSERPLFRDELGRPGGDVPGRSGVLPVDPVGRGRIASGETATTSDSYATHAPAGQSRQEDASMPVCTRCGHRNAEASRFCSNCGASLRAGVPERPSETTSTISISGLEAYEAEATGQTASPSLSAEAQEIGRAHV